MASRLSPLEQSFKFLWDRYHAAKPKLVKWPKPRAAKPKVKRKHKRLPRVRVKVAREPKIRPHRKIVKGRCAAARYRRLLLEAASGPGYTRQEFLDLCSLWNNQCLRCKSTTAKLVPDHIVPLSRGGEHAIGNIQPLCWKCNLWKGTRLENNDFRS